jgi:hypothetical protein
MRELEGEIVNSWLEFRLAPWRIRGANANHSQKENAMRIIRVLLALLLVLASTAPVRADFEYTETSQVTGGALIGMVKFASVFARGDAKKQEQQALQPTTTTHYIKGDRLRTDRPDGTASIIDLAGRRVIAIDLNKKTYAVATFDDIKAALEQARLRMQQQMQQNPQQAQQVRQTQDTQIKITPTIHVTPGSGSRVILNQPTNETKVQMDIAMQATATGPNAPPPGQPNSATATYSMNVDTFVAPGVTGYQEFAQFYRRMAQEVNWMTLPAMNVQIDPRVAQGMSELQKNSDALKGFPLLSYVSMTIAAAANGQPLAAGSQNSAQNQPPPNSPLPEANGTSDSSIPTSPSAAVMKGLGGLFGRKKQDNSAAPSSQGGAGSSQPGAAPPNPNSNPNALMEITTQVTAFTDSSLNGGLFDIPAGYTQVQEDPMQVFGGARSN